MKSHIHTYIIYKQLHGGTEIGTEGGGGALPAAAQPGLETNSEEHKVATKMRAGRDPRSGQGRMIRDVSRAVSISDRRRWRSARTAPEPPRKRGRAAAGLRRGQRRRRRAATAGGARAWPSGPRAAAQAGSSGCTTRACLLQIPRNSRGQLRQRSVTAAGGASGRRAASKVD